MEMSNDERNRLIVNEVVDNLVSETVTNCMIFNIPSDTYKLPVEDCASSVSSYESDLESTIKAVNLNTSLDSITSITSDQSTQTDDLVDTSDSNNNNSNLLLSAVPTELAKQIQDEAPWLLTAFDNLEKRLKIMEGNIDENRNCITGNSTQIANNRQYLSRNCLLIHRLNDIPFKKKGEAFSKYVVNKLNTLFPRLRWMGRRINNDDIDAAHPLKSRKNPKSKIVIVKFKVRDLRNKIYFSKSNLKNTNIGISEHLTQKTLALLKKTKASFRDKKVWTEECKIYVAWGHKSQKCVHDEETLNKLLLLKCNADSQTEPKMAFQKEASSTTPSNSSVQVSHEIENLGPSHVDCVMLTEPEIKNQMNSRNGSEMIASQSTQMHHYSKILNVFDNWNVQRRQNHDNEKRAYRNWMYNPEWRKGHSGVYRGRGKFIPKTNRGRGHFNGMGRGHSTGGRGRGVSNRGKGQFSDYGHERFSDYGHEQSGKGHFIDYGHEQRGYYNSSHERGMHIERGGYYNSLYRNTNCDF